MELVTSTFHNKVATNPFDDVLVERVFLFGQYIFFTYICFIIIKKTLKMDLVKIPTKTKKFNFQFTPESELRGQNLRNFVFAGNALFTVLNEETNNHVTFKVKKHKEDEVWFVTVLHGHNYVNIGTCFSDKKFKVKRDGHLNVEDQKVKVFTWLLDTFFNNQDKYQMVKVYHHGRCGACHKTLTTPESIKSGIGPVCGGKKKN